jgi:hypothetical protein
VTVKDVIENMHSEKKQITMASIEIVGDIKKGNNKQNVEKINPQTLLKLNSMAVFRDEKLIDFFDSMESRGNSWIQNKIKKTVIKVPCSKKGNVVIEVIHSSTNTKMKFQQGQRVIVIHLKQEANIGENTCPGLELSDEKTIVDLEKQTQEQIKKEILASLNQAKKWKSDIFGFGKAVYKANPVIGKKTRTIGKRFSLKSLFKLKCRRKSDKKEQETDPIIKKLIKKEEESMLAVCGILAVGMVIFFTEGRTFWKQKKRNEMIIFSVSLLMALILNITVALDLPFPSTSEVIGKVLEPITNPIVRWTKGGTS